MSKTSYSLMLRDLSNDYYHRHIEIDEYRAQRKKILDKIDEEFNGRRHDVPQSESKGTSPEFINTVEFYNNSEIEK